MAGRNIRGLLLRPGGAVSGGSFASAITARRAAALCPRHIGKTRRVLAVVRALALSACRRIYTPASDPRL